MNDFFYEIIMKDPFDKRCDEREYDKVLEYLANRDYALLTLDSPVGKRYCEYKVKGKVMSMKEIDDKFLDKTLNASVKASEIIWFSICKIY